MIKVKALIEVEIEFGDNDLHSKLEELGYEDVKDIENMSDFVDLSSEFMTMDRRILSIKEI